MAIEALNKDNVEVEGKPISYWVGKAYMKFFGWEAVGEPPEEKKFVLICAPHTSNWDLPHMLGVSYVLGFKISWMGKHHIFKNPLSRRFFTWLGGVPVDRSAPQGLVQQAIDIFEESDSLILAVPPEGTRGKTTGWKTGFYHIAHGAGVPVVCAFLDFENKRGGFGPTLYTTGDIDADVAKLEEFYKDIRGKYPELESPIRVRTKRRYESRKKSTKKKGSVGKVVGKIGRKAGGTIAAAAAAVLQAPQQDR